MDEIIDLPSYLETNIIINIDKIKELENKFIKEEENLRNTNIPKLIKLIKNNPSSITKKSYDNLLNTADENIDNANKLLNHINVYKNKITEVNNSLDKMTELFRAVKQHNEFLVSNINNTYLNTKGSLSQLALNTLPNDDKSIIDQISNLAENMNINNEELIDPYMSVINFERNKYDLQKNYNPPNINSDLNQNNSTGGKKTRRRLNKRKNSNKRKK